jgi:hypothetical protein
MSMIQRANGVLPARYDDTIGWIIDVDEPISEMALANARSFIYKINRERYVSMRPGDAKDRVGRALQSLKAGKIQQRITGKKYRESTLFSSTEKESSTIYSIPGVNHG